MNPNWDSDGVDGGPTSLDVVLLWIEAPGNASRLLQSSRKRDGSRCKISSEIYDLLCSSGITYRSCIAIKTKLWELMKQYGKAEKWLETRGLSQFDVSKDSENAVLQICPNYCDMARLFRSETSQSTNSRAKTRQTVENNHSDDEIDPVQEDISGNSPRHEPLKDGKQQRYRGYPKWDADGVDGSLSSLEVLLEWLTIPGNAWRAWMGREGPQRELNNEVYKFLVSRGITYRTRLAIGFKLQELDKQLVAAENWLETRGLHRYAVRVCEKTEREVLRICPHYHELSPLFHPQQLLKSTASNKEQTFEESDQNSDENANDSGQEFNYDRAASQPVDYTIKWNSDSINGGPTSLDLLMKWLTSPGNAARWLGARRNYDIRIKMAKQIRDKLVRHGIKHRSNRTIYSKLCSLNREFDEAEKWLSMRRIRQFDINVETEESVLRICPLYRKISPLFRSPAISPKASSNNRPATKSVREYRDNDDETGEDFPCGADYSDSTTQEPDVDYSNTKWDSDAMDGGPSSLNVLLKWILIPGNAARWQEAARAADGSRWTLASEIYDLLLVHGITHRTPCGAESKLRALEEQFDKAETWLLRKGINDFKDTVEAERIVLQLCPVYPKVGPLLRSSHQSARSRAKHSISTDVRFRTTASNAESTQLSGSKRVRNEVTRYASTRNTKKIVVLEAKPEERQEFFKLELQIKRDEAVLVRAKARKELFDIGVSAVDVERLLPL